MAVAAAAESAAAMNRRSFFGVLAGVVAAPLLPTAPFASIDATSHPRRFVVLTHEFIEDAMMPLDRFIRERLQSDLDYDFITGTFLGVWNDGP